MKKFAYCYRATDSGLFGDVWLSPEDSRHVKAGLIAAGEQGKFQESFLKRTELYQIGDFEDETGVFAALDKPLFIMSLSEVIAYVKHPLQPEE